MHSINSQQSCQSQNQSNRERKVFSTSDVVTTGNLYGEMKIILTFPSHYTKKKKNTKKIDLRWFIELTVKPRIVNLLEEKNRPEQMFVKGDVLMTNMHMKRSSTTLVIRELHI